MKNYRPAYLITVVLFSTCVAHADDLALRAPIWLSMGPDPGGHTGEKVTPRTTRTDNAAVDAKRARSSGERVETSVPTKPSATTDEK